MKTFEETKRELREVRVTIMKSIDDEAADVAALKARHAEYRAKLQKRFAALCAELVPEPPPSRIICTHPAMATIFDQTASGEVTATCGHCGEPV